MAKSADQIWDAMMDRARTMIDVAAIAAQSGEPSETEMLLLSGGAAIGVAAATEHYAINPEDIPMEALRRKIINTIDPLWGGQQVKQAVLDLLSYEDS